MAGAGLHISKQACRGAPLLAGILGPAEAHHCAIVLILHLMGPATDRRGGGYIVRQACKGAPLLAGVLGPADGLQGGSIHLGGLVLQQLRILFPDQLPV